MSNIITIPLNIVNGKTNEHIKNARAQLKAVYDASRSQLTLTAACEEGIFEARLNMEELHVYRSKQDLEDTAWQTILLSLLGIKLSENEQTKNMRFSAKLTTEDSYNVETGELMAGCDDKLPIFELSVNTRDVLSILYGRIPLLFKDVELIPYGDRAEYNLLTWISGLVSDNQQLREDARIAQEKLEQSESVCNALENEIQQMTSDYRAILQDLENRFFQVLNEKRRKIAELEPDVASNLELLNLEYVKRNSTNLNRVYVEDIVAGKKLVSPTKRSRSRKRPRTGHDDSDLGIVKMECPDSSASKESSPTKVKMEHTPKMEPALKAEQSVGLDGDRRMTSSANQLPSSPDFSSSQLFKSEADIIEESYDVAESGVMEENELDSRDEETGRRTSVVSSGSTNYSSSEDDNAADQGNHGSSQHQNPKSSNLDIAATLPESAEEESGNETQYSD